MAINKGSKKLTTLTKSALKNLEGNTRAWFLIERKGKDMLFGVDKKQANPAKYKKTAAVKKYLTTLDIENTSTIKDNAALVCGTVTTVGENVEFVISFKVNGGSKSMVKSSAAELKKICPTFKLVKSATDESMAATDAEVEEEAPADAKGEDPKAIKVGLKVVKWWTKSARSQLVEAEGAPSANEDFLQDLQRRLSKFKTLKCYKLFREGKVLADKKPEDFDLDKENLRVVLNRIKAALAALPASTEEDDADTAQMISESLEAMVDDLDLIAEMMALSVSGTAAFKEAAAENKDTLILLWKDFSNRTKDLVLLKDVLGSGSWNDFFQIAAKFEQA
jgi:hypothetical protein